MVLFVSNMFCAGRSVISVHPHQRRPSHYLPTCSWFDDHQAVEGPNEQARDEIDGPPFPPQGGVQSLGVQCERGVAAARTVVAAAAAAAAAVCGGNHPGRHQDGPLGGQVCGRPPYGKDGQKVERCLDVQWVCPVAEVVGSRSSKLVPGHGQAGRHGPHQGREYEDPFHGDQVVGNDPDVGPPGLQRCCVVVVAVACRPSPYRHQPPLQDCSGDDGPAKGHGGQPVEQGPEMGGRQQGDGRRGQDGLDGQPLARR